MCRASSTTRGPFICRIRQRLPDVTTDIPAMPIDEAMQLAAS